MEHLKSYHENLIKEIDTHSFKLKKPSMNESFISIPLHNKYEFVNFSFDYESEHDLNASVIFINNWDWKNTIIKKTILRENKSKFSIQKQIQLNSHVIIYYSAEFIIKNFTIKEYFTNVLSLGTWCMASQYLKHAGIKKESYPFDWILTTFDITSDCIETEFSEFLNKDHMIYKCISKYPQVDHKFYNINMFLHHDPLNNEKDYKYFQRCVQRFQDMYKKKDKNIMFFSIFHHRPTRREIDRILRYLQMRFENFLLLIVYNMQSYEDEHFSEEKDYIQSKHVRIFQLFSDKFVDDNWHGMKTYSTIDKIFDNFCFV